jgi:hypothetical protein
MPLYTYYITRPVSQLIDQVEQSHAEDLPLLKSLLDMVVLRTTARALTEPQRQMALSLLRSQPERFVAWLDEASPSTRLAISEALTRALLARTVE